MPHERSRHAGRNYLYLSFDIELGRASLTYIAGRANMETQTMFRTPLIAGLMVALLGGTALAQPANSPPPNLSNSARNAPDYDDNNGPPPGYNGPQQGNGPQGAR